MPDRTISCLARLRFWQSVNRDVTRPPYKSKLTTYETMGRWGSIPRRARVDTPGVLHDMMIREINPDYALATYCGRKNLAVLPWRDFPLDNERVGWEKVAQGLGIRWTEAKSLLVKTTISYLNEFLKFLRVVPAQRFNC